MKNTQLLLTRLFTLTTSFELWTLFDVIEIGVYDFVTTT